MYLKIYKFLLIFTSLIFLSGCLQSAALIGPGITVASSGNIAKASVQLVIDHSVKKETGKNSIDFVKDEVVKKNKKRRFHKNFVNLVEKRVELTHKKLNRN